MLKIALTGVAFAAMVCAGFPAHAQIPTGVSPERDSCLAAGYRPDASGWGQCLNYYAYIRRQELSEPTQSSGPDLGEVLAKLAIGAAVVYAASRPQIYVPPVAAFPTIQQPDYWGSGAISPYGRQLRCTASGSAYLCR